MHPLVQPSDGALNYCWTAVERNIKNTVTTVGINTRFINHLTTVMGVIIIGLSVYSVFCLEKVTWFDSLFGGMFGTMLIYVKNSGVGKIVTAYFKNSGGNNNSSYNTGFPREHI